MKSLGNYETDGPIGTKFGTHLRINLGIDICRQNMLPLETPGGHLGFVGVKNTKVWEIYPMAGPIGTKFCTFLLIHLGRHFWGFKGSNIKTLGENGWTDSDQFVRHVFRWFWEWTHVEKNWPSETQGGAF